jgi:hypothetical protein
MSAMNPLPSSPGDDPQNWTSPFEELLAQGPAVPGANSGGVRHLDPVFGTPAHDVAFWEGQQNYPDDCAIKCQQFVLEQFTGRHIDEQSLVREAAEHGWYQPGQGTPLLDVGKLLELHGVAVNRYEHASQFHLAQELAQGHKVIVGVESTKLLDPNPILDAIHEALGVHGSADHAVVVTGIDTGDPRHVLVQISDPGTGQALAAYPMEQFLDAWHGSDFFMVATQEPAPAHLPEMVNFDYTLGHIHEIADVPYEQFLEYAGHPEAWEDVVQHYVEDHFPDASHHGFDDEAFAGHHGDDAAPDLSGHHHDWAVDPHHLDGEHAHPDAADHHPGPDDLHDHEVLPGHDVPDDQLPHDWS